MFTRRVLTFLALPLLAVVLAGAAAQAAPRPAVSSVSWRNVEIVGGGYVTGLLYHPTARDLAYARTDIGGAYRWNPQTRRWIPLTDHLGWDDWNLLGVESVGLDPRDAGRVYLAVGTYTQSWATNGAILRSADRGRSWQRTDLPFKLGGNEGGRAAGERLLVDPNDGRVLYLGSRLDGLWRSTDAGVTWAKVTSFPVQSSPDTAGIPFVVADPRSGEKGSPTRTLYAGFAGAGTKLFRSTDAGASWAAVPGQPDDTLIPQQAKIDRAGTLYVTYADHIGPNGMTNGGVWKLDTGTGTWTDITPLRPNTGTESGFGYTGVDVDRNRPGTLVVTTNNRWGPGDDVFRSTDGGDTWKSVQAASERDASAAPYLGYDHGKVELGHWLGAIAINPHRPGDVMYGTGATIWGTKDITNLDKGRTTHWTVRAQGLEETAVQDLVSPPRGAHLISGLFDIGGFRHDTLSRSPRQGMSKNPVFSATTDIDFAQHRPEFVVRVGTVWTGSRRGAYSTDGGTTWTPFVNEPAGIVNGGGTVAASADGGRIVWTPGDGTPAAYSTDRGTTWLPVTGLPAGSPLIVADRVRENVFYAFSATDGTLHRSTDGAATFTPAGSGLPAAGAQLHAVAGAEGELWLAAGGAGLWRSTDGGATFTRITGVDAADNLGFGKAAPGKRTPTLYSSAQVNGVRGIYRSTDTGKSWVRINDDRQQWGWTGKTITGDPRIYGRVYLGTNGRGVQYADTAHR